MAQLPSIPKGTRDYSPEIMVKRNYIFDTIKSVFKRYGYMPLETPAMENLSTLMGKYGERLLVFTFMPFSQRVAQAGARFLRPSTSTTQIRQEAGRLVIHMSFRFI